MLVHLVDVAGEGDPVAAYETVRARAGAYGAGLAGCPSWWCSRSATWSRRGGRAHCVAEWRERLGERVLGVLAVSSATGAGLDELRRAIFAAGRRGADGRPPRRRRGEPEFEAEHRVYRPGRRAGLRGRARGRRRLPGPGRGVELLFARHDLANDEALGYLEQRLNEIGVIAALERAGFEPGDEVRVGEHEFELHPGEAELRYLHLTPPHDRGRQARLLDRRRRRRCAARRRARLGLRAGRRAPAGGENVVMVTSGAIARGHAADGAAGARPRAIDELQAASAVGQGDLFRAYEERLAGQRVHAAQVLLTSFDMPPRMHYLNARQTLRRLLDWRAVPVSTRTTRPRPTRSPSATTTSSPPRWRSCSRRGCWSCSPTSPAFTPPTRAGDPEASLVEEVGDFTELASTRSATAPRPSARAGCGARSRRPRWPARPGSRS